MNQLASNWMRNLILAIIAGLVAVFVTFALGKIDQIYAESIQLVEQHTQMEKDIAAEHLRIDAELATKATHDEVEYKIKAAIASPTAKSENWPRVNARQ
jgi:hypothetical protein